MAALAAPPLDDTSESLPNQGSPVPSPGYGQPTSLRRSQQLDQVFTALVAAQTALIDPAVDQSNPDFVDHRYASLASFVVPNRAVLKQHGLAVLQFTDGDALVSMLAHTSGQFIEGRTPLLLVSADMQGLGSAISYARRYGYQAILGLVQTDDDGRASVKAPATASGAVGGSNVSAFVAPIRGNPGAGAPGAPGAPGATGASGASADAGSGATPALPAKTSGFNVQATVDAIKKKSLVSELDVALTRVRSLFTGADLTALEKAIADRRAEIEATSAAAVS